MNINFLSKVEDIKQAIAGTWSLSKDHDWTSLEQGNLKLYKKLCTEGKNVLPDKFLQDREDITPYLAFTKNGVSGGLIRLQQQYIELDSSAIVIILSF